MASRAAKTRSRGGKQHLFSRLPLELQLMVMSYHIDNISDHSIDLTGFHGHDLPLVQLLRLKKLFYTHRWELTSRYMAKVRTVLTDQFVKLHWLHKRVDPAHLQRISDLQIIHRPGESCSQDHNLARLTDIEACRQVLPKLQHISLHWFPTSRAGLKFRVLNPEISHVGQRELLVVDGDTTHTILTQNESFQLPEWLCRLRNDISTGEITAKFVIEVPAIVVSRAAPDGRGPAGTQYEYWSDYAELDLERAMLCVGEGQEFQTSLWRKLPLLEMSLSY